MEKVESKILKIFFPAVLALFCSFICRGQYHDDKAASPVNRHFISINPLNMALFQQVGITYEYKAGVLGFGLTPGYIYPNKQEYSNWFMAGPTKNGSLGDYSGFFVVPQIYIHLTELNDSEEGSAIYITPKFIFKHMHVDSATRTVWDNHGDGYSGYRKMIDNANVYGGFVDFGFRYFLGHFFMDLNLGPGIMWVNHRMVISGEWNGKKNDPVSYCHPARREDQHTRRMTLNFTLNLGFAFR